MPRYRAVGPVDVKENRPYRITAQYRDSTTVTIEGKVYNLSGTKLNREKVPTHAHFLGDVSIPISTEGYWRVKRIDEVHPDLPTTAGSVAVVDGKTIILVPDSGGGETAPSTRWVYALDLGKQVPWKDLNEADVLRDAGA